MHAGASLLGRWCVFKRWKSDDTRVFLSFDHVSALSLAIGQVRAEVSWYSYGYTGNPAGCSCICICG
jgi:hypothetical protein